jgi:hypothetical protein
MPDRRSCWIAPPNSPISALSLRIFRGRGSSTAAQGALDRLRVQCPIVRLQPFLDVEHALVAAKGFPLANEGEACNRDNKSFATESNNERTSQDGSD